MSEGDRPRKLPVPRPMNDHEAGLDASIRRKQERGEPLDAQERAFLARLPADKGIPPAAVKDAYDEA